MGTPYEQDIVAWDDTVGKAIEETGLDDFPGSCPWSMDQVLSVEFLPGD